MNTPVVSTVSDATALESSSSSPLKISLVRGLSLLDAVLLIVGGVIGSAIFLTAADIANPLPHPLYFVMVWAVGGLVSILACFAFAELAAMFPQSGGQYIYMREAYGDLVAFLYGWMIFTVSCGGSIAALAVGFAEYMGAIVPAISRQHVIWTGYGIVLTRAHLVAVGSIAFLTWINVVGLRRGAILQNIATWLKFAAMAVFVGLGLTIGKGYWSHFTTTGVAAGAGGPGLFMGHSPWHLLPAFGVALIAVFWAYDGWIYATWVSGEVKNPQRNLPRALVIGVIAVTVIYIAMNLVYLYALPMTKIATTGTVAHAAAEKLFSPAAAIWLSAMIALSCFGANASCILSGARVYFAMARDGVFFQKMAEVHPRWRTPAFSLIGQGVWGAILCLSGRYDQLYTYVMFMMVVSYLAGVGALFVLRRKQPHTPRPYRCTGYPWLPVLYLIFGGLWALNALVERPKEALAGIVIVLIGVPGYLYWKRAARKTAI